MNLINVFVVLIALIFLALPFAAYLLARQSAKFREFELRFNCAAEQAVCGFIATVRPLVHVIVNNYGYIAVGNKEISRVYAAAPPTAPPKKPIFTEFQIYEILRSLIPPILDELSEKENQLKKQEIRNYTTQKLVPKIAKNQRSYPLNFAENPANFTIFEKNIKFCIIKQILPTLAIASRKKNKKAEQILKEAVAAYTRWDVDIDADLPAADGEKMRTYHDVIPGNAPEPLSILIQLEQSQAKQVALAALTAEQKARLIEQFDACRRTETGELFDVAEVAKAETVPAQPSSKYRRKPKPVPLQVAQPSLFAGVLS